MKTNKTNWTSITDLTKRSIRKGLFVKTPNTKTEFYKDSGRCYVNITNWHINLKKHVYYKLEHGATTNYLFVEMRDARTDSLLQSNTFTTVKELKEYLKTL